MREPSGSAAVSEESRRNLKQRSYSSFSPMSPAARAGVCGARRKPRFGSCSQENGWVGDLARICSTEWMGDKPPTGEAATACRAAGVVKPFH